MSCSLKASITKIILGLAESLVLMTEHANKCGQGTLLASRPCR